MFLNRWKSGPISLHRPVPLSRSFKLVGSQHARANSCAPTRARQLLRANSCAPTRARQLERPNLRAQTCVPKLACPNLRAQTCAPKLARPNLRAQTCAPKLARVNLRMPTLPAPTCARQLLVCLITLSGSYSDFALFVCEYVYIEILLRNLILSEFSLYVGTAFMLKPNNRSPIHKPVGT